MWNLAARAQLRVANATLCNLSEGSAFSEGGRGPWRGKSSGLCGGSMRSLMVGAASAILRKLGLTLIADGSGYVLTASWRIRESGVRGHLKALSHSHHLRSLFSDLRVDCEIGRAHV